MALSCMLGHRQNSTLQGLHIAMPTHNCGISLRLRVPPLGYAPCIPPYTPPPFTAIMYIYIYIYIYIYMGWAVWGTAFVLFLFYVNVSGMRLWSRFSSQPLTILAPWVFLCIRWSITLVKWFHHG